MLRADRTGAGGRLDGRVVLDDTGAPARHRAQGDDERDRHRGGHAETTTWVAWAKSSWTAWVSACEAPLAPELPEPPLGAGDRVRDAVRRAPAARRRASSVRVTRETVSVIRIEPSTASPRLPPKFRTVCVTPVTAP